MRLEPENKQKHGTGAGQIAVPALGPDSTLTLCKKAFYNGG